MDKAINQAGGSRADRTVDPHGRQCPSVLVVDDDSMICELLGAVLEADYHVICAGTSNEALRMLAEQSIDVILLDYHLEYGGAIDVAKRAEEIGIPMVWITGDHAVEVASHSVLLKPFTIDQLAAMLAKVRTSAHSVLPK